MLEQDPLGVWTWFEFYEHWRAGYLPYEGGFLDQPAVFNDAMALIQSRVNERIESEGKEDGAEGR